MRRADRLFELLQLLRQAKQPLTALAIAEALETSQRTIYRDIAALLARRVPIRGEAGVGYVLDRSFHLPPLMLTLDEVEAVALGCQWVIAHGDAELGRAASSVLRKVASNVPPELRVVIEDPTVGTPPRRAPAQGRFNLGDLRRWCRTSRTLDVHYEDEQGRSTRRVVHPFLIGFDGEVRVMIAWCELRGDVRIFRLDRVRRLELRDALSSLDLAGIRKAWLAKVNALETRAGAPRPLSSGW